MLTLYQGAYHEIHNEPDGLQDKLLDEIIAFIDSHVDSAPASALEDAPAAVAQAEPPVIKSSL